MSSVTIKNFPKRYKGGAGSGFHGHAGRPGKVGGSAAFGAGVAPNRDDLQEYEFAHAEPADRPLVREATDVYIKTLQAQDNENAGKWHERIQAYIDDLNAQKAAGNYGARLHVLNYDQVREAMKDQICTELSQRTGIDYETVKTVVHQWAETSNEDYRSLSLQEAASEELGIPLSSWQKRLLKTYKERAISPAMVKDATHMYNEAMRWLDANKPHWGLQGQSPLYEKARKLWMEKYPDSKFTWDDVYYADVESGTDEGFSLTSRENERKIIRAMYDYTQEQLKDAPDELILYRGVKGAPLKKVFAKYPNPTGEKVAYKGNAMESWTTDSSIAENFALSAQGSAIFAMKVPKKNVIATCISGFGCLNEREYVIAGSLPKQTALIVDSHLPWGPQ